MNRLGQTDRDALLLRYLQNKSLREVGAALGMKERAAQKQVARGLEKLRLLLSKRGVALSAAAIAGSVSANSVQAAPAGLAMTISASVVKGSAVAASVTTLVQGTLKTMTSIKLKLALGLGIVTILAGGAVTLAISQGGTGDKLTAQAIAKKSQAAYAALSSYSDDGTVVTEGGGSTTTTTFHIRLQRPNLYRIDWLSSGGFYTGTGIVWSDGTGDYLVSGRAGDKEKGQPQRMANMQFALGAAGGFSGSAASTIPGAFFSQGGGDVLAFVAQGTEKNNKKERDEKVGAVDCFVISSSVDMDKSGKLTTRLWIGKQDSLIHKTQSIMEHFSTPTIQISDSLVKNALAEKNEPATPAAMSAMRTKIETEMKQAQSQLKSGKMTFTQTCENISVNQKYPVSDFAR